MITKLNIKSFRGLHDVDYDKFGLVNVLYGKNGCGKSTILDCIMWLITGETLKYGESKSADDKLINELKPNELIECSIQIDGENELSRIYGHKIDEDSGNIIDVNAFYSNGRRCKSQREYYDEVNRFFQFNLSTKERINLLTALINPYTFGEEIDQNVFRRFISEILNVDFVSKVFEDKKYSSIKSDYQKQGYDLGNLKTYIRQSISKCKENIENYKVKISSNDTIKFDEKELVELETKMFEAKSNNYSISNKEIEETFSKLQNAENELSVSIRNDLVNNVSQEEKDMAKKVNQEKVSINNKIDEYNELYRNQVKLKADIEMLEIQLQSSNALLEETISKKFVEVVCPKCSTIINKDDQDKFNLSKAEKIKELRETIDKLKKMIDPNKEETNSNEMKLKELMEEIGKDKENLEKDKKALEQLNINETKNCSSEKTKSLELARNSLKEHLVDIQKNENDKQSKFIEEKTKIISDLGTKIETLKANQKAFLELETIKTFKKQELEKMASLESEKSLCEDFGNDISRITKEYTSKIFGDQVDFVMLQKNKTNDSYKNVCYARVKGVSYDSLNTANALLTGIVVIEKIKKYIGGCNLPIIFDIGDNIGKKVMGDILEQTSSQIFYTEIDKTDKSERELKVIK